MWQRGIAVLSSEVCGDIDSAVWHTSPVRIESDVAAIHQNGIDVLSSSV